MLRVCGVTFDHTTNYGSCFQAYALQTAIENLQIRGEQCEYGLIPVHTLLDYPVKRSWQRNVIKPILKLHRTQFVPFEKKCMKYVPVSRLTDLPSLNEQMDAFVCGSDVIWNPDFNDNLGVFFLDFAHKYKFSYAASFGKADIGEKQYLTVGKYLSSFNAISVREKTGQEIARRCVDKSVSIVVDPVLLLGSQTWDKLLTPDKKEDKYIFVYMTHLNDSIISFIEKLRKVTGLKVIRSANGPKQTLKQVILQVQKPEKWLQQLRDAEYVVTNSFHATAFSVLFHKKFFTVVHGGKSQGINVRMNDFLKYVGLEDRIFSAVPETIDLNEIQFSEADKKIEALRQKSLDYLQTNLEKAYDETHRARM